MMLGAIYASLLPEQPNSFILGMCSASLIWFMSLASIVSLCRNFFTPRLLRYINFICGIIMILFGLKLIFEVF